MFNKRLMSLIVSFGRYVFKVFVFSGSSLILLCFLLKCVWCLKGSFLVATLFCLTFWFNCDIIERIKIVVVYFVRLGVMENR